MARALWCVALMSVLVARTFGGQAGAFIGGDYPACDARSQGFLYGMATRPLVIRGTVARLWSDSSQPVGWREWSTVAVNEVLKGRFEQPTVDILGHYGKEGSEYLFALPDTGTPFLDRGPDVHDCAAYILEVVADQVEGHIDSLTVTAKALLSRIGAALRSED